MWFLKIRLGSGKSMLHFKLKLTISREPSILRAPATSQWDALFQRGGTEVDRPTAVPSQSHTFTSLTVMSSMTHRACVVTTATKADIMDNVRRRYLNTCPLWLCLVEPSLCPKLLLFHNSKRCQKELVDATFETFMWCCMLLMGIASIPKKAKKLKNNQTNK